MNDVAKRTHGKPQWKRYLHANGKFAFELDVINGVIRCVERQGTVTYDLIAEMEKARQAVDSTAINNV